MGKVWYVLRSKPNKEAFLAGQLESRNITVLDLQVKVNPVNPRARRHKPYFPGYIFIHTDLQQHPPVLFERIPGAARLVHVGNEIACVPDNIIQAIRSPHDPWLVAADFRSYVDAQERAAVAYRDRERWTRMSILNTAASGKFSTDRTMAEYNAEIWRLTPVVPTA